MLLCALPSCRLGQTCVWWQLVQRNSYNKVQ
jgi:hypothetical protein